MLKLRTTPNLYGVTLMGDYEDLDKLYDSISNYLEFYQNSHDRILPYHEYEYLLSLNYDIRHCYQGYRGYEIVGNNSDRYGSMADVIFKASEQFKDEIENVHAEYKNGNLYYTVEILYPFIFHYLVEFDRLLEEEPDESWFEEVRENGQKWKEQYTMIDAARDRGQLMHLTGLFWQNLQELLGPEKANVIYDYYTGVDFPAPTSMYCNTLIHCQIVNFEEMTEEEKLDFYLASIYEIIDVEDMYTYPDEVGKSLDQYEKAIDTLNKDGRNRFPVREEFYNELDKVYDPAKPFYRNNFEDFLNDTYGQDPDPFGTDEFHW